MKLHPRVAVLVLSLAAIGACSKKQPAAAPDPGPATQTPSDDAERARREAEERARREAEAERARMRASLEERIHFEYDRSEVRAEDRSIMDAKAEILSRSRDVSLTITGHADERGSIEYNLALGMRRAQAAREYLTAYGVDGARLEISSLGEQDPIDTGSSESAWARNRRAEFRVTGGLVATNR